MKSLTHLEMIERDRNNLRKLLAEAIAHLERGYPPPGGRTDRFIKKAKKAL